MIEIIEITHMDDSIYKSICHLFPQLDPTEDIPSQTALEEIAASSGSILFGAIDSSENTFLGMLTLAVVRVPTGVRSWIEDVVVDSNARGQGIGGKLVKAALERAKREGVKTVDLTSRPSREAANRLYRRCGFVLRETNLYRYSFSSRSE